MNEVEILTQEDAICIKKKNKTAVNYFLFDEYEIHLNQIPPHSLQEWHKHSIIEEVLVVTSGKILLKWLEQGKCFEKIIEKGTVARVEKSIHTIENNFDELAEFTVFCIVLSGESQRDKIKNDKEIVTVNIN